MQSASAIGFANELEQMRPQIRCDLLVSLERIWGCDVYRAGDGVHRAWLERWAQMGGPWPKLGRLVNRKHGGTLALEKSLFAAGGCAWLMTDSRIGQAASSRFYGSPARREV